MRKLTHGSLFSGIGGFDLAAEWAGWENKFHCEWNEFGKRVLNYYWPEVECYGDITKTDFRKWRGQIDVLTGGFPCQPYSVAGKRLGKEDERHLWPHMLRSIREIKPKYVVGENVRGIISWNGGLVFDEVQADLEAEGYTVIPCVLPACGVNAPHRRERVWFVAVKDPDKDGWGSDKREEKSRVGKLGNVGARDNVRISSDNGEIGNAANSASERLEGCIGRSPERERFTSDCSEDVANTNSKRDERFSTDIGTSENSGQRRESAKKTGNFGYASDWVFFPTQPPICGGDDGLPRELDGITFPKWRSESIKAYGNAIVPAVAFEIFKVINEIDKFLNENSYLL